MSTSKHHSSPQKLDSNGISYNVVLNYFNRRSEDERGISLEYRNDLLKSFTNKMEAFAFARQRRFSLKQRETLYIIERKGNKMASGSDVTNEKSIHYMNIVRDSPCS